MTAEMNEKKVRSIRADEETYAKFKSICEEMGGQNEALAALISSYELDKAKCILSGQADSIDDFRSRIDGLINSYLYALEMSANAEERIRRDYRERIESQAKTIEMLQLKAEVAESNLQALQDRTSEQLREIESRLSESEKKAKAETEKAETATREREQAEKISAMTAEQATVLKDKVAELTDKAEHSDSYKAELDKSRSELTVLSAELTILKKQLAEQQERYVVERTALEEQQRKELETAVKVAIAETKEKYIEKIEQLQENQAKQIAELTAVATSVTKKTEKVTNTTRKN